MIDWVEVPHHAYEMWRDRSPDTSIGPRVAWRRSRPVPEELWDGNVYAMAVYVHEPTEMLLIVDENEHPGYDDYVIKTCFPLDDRDWHQPIRKWLDKQR